MTRQKKAELRGALYLVQQGLCAWCGGEMSLTRKKTGQPARDFATFEHLTRRAEGGKLDLNNIVLAHYKCNVRRNHELQTQQQNP